MNLLVNGAERVIKCFIACTGYTAVEDRPLGILLENILQTMKLDTENVAVIFHIRDIIGGRFPDIETIFQVGSDERGILYDHSHVAVLAPTKAFEEFGDKLIASEEQDVSCFEGGSGSGRRGGHADEIKLKKGAGLYTMW